MFEETEAQVEQMDAQQGNRAARRVPSLALAVVGLSFLWPCLGSSATMSFRHAMANSASVITGEWHAVAMSALYLLAIALCLAERSRIEHLLTGARRTLAVVLTGALGIAGHLLLVGSPRMGDSTPLVTAIVIVGFAGAVAFIVGHILAWGALLKRFSLGQALFAVAASNALSYGVQLGCDTISAGVLLGYLIGCPLGSAVGWVAVDCTQPAAEEPKATEGPTIGDSLKSLSWRLIGPSLALIYFEQVFSSLLFKRYTLWPRDNLTVTLAVGAALWVVASLYLGRLILKRPEGTNPQRSFGSALAVVFAGLLVVYLGALLATLMFPQGDGLVVERFLVAAGSSFRVLLWLVITLAVGQGRSDLVTGYLVYVLFVLALPVSRLMTLVLDQIPAPIIDTLTSPTAIVTAAGIMLFLIAAAFIMGSTRKTTQIEEEVAAEEEQDPVDALAKEAGLSPRETDVLRLVCHGFTAKGAGEKLNISESTVVSHMTHIYRKLGVSSKQELVALVAARKKS